MSSLQIFSFVGNGKSLKNKQTKNKNKKTVQLKLVLMGGGGDP